MKETGRFDDAKWKFDVFVFTTTAEYLCYIEAVALLYEENVLKSCDFITDKNVFIKEHYDFK